MSAMGSEPVPLTAREAASGLLGSVSLTCWIFLLVGFILLYFASFIMFYGSMRMNEGVGY